MIPLPSVCPQCRSTAVDPGLAMASCWTCGWKGPTGELLTVVSDGLTLEETVDKFARDLLTVVAANLSKPLGEFLLRWDVVKKGDTDVIRLLIGKSVEHIAGNVLEYLLACAAPEEKKG